jgi:glycosyltransferase involved in cell wall biosynthesis
MNKKDVTIVIPHYDTEKANRSLKECLTSLVESEFPLENIIVSFNGEVCSELYPDGVRWLYVPEQGQCRAVNAAVAISSTPWIMVTNNDMIYPKDWFERLTDIMIAEPDEDLTGSNKVEKLQRHNLVVSPQLIEPNDGAPTFRRYFCGGAGGDFDKKRFMEYVEKEHVSVGLRSGFNLPFLIKRSVWNMIGGYDVNYDPWGSNSDSDLEYKLKLAGVPMIQNTNCPVYHFSMTSGTFEPQNSSFWQKNFAYFEEKWGFPRTDQGIWEATFEIPFKLLKFLPIWRGIYSRRTH